MAAEGGVAVTLGKPSRIRRHSRSADSCDEGAFTVKSNTLSVYIQCASPEVDSCGRPVILVVNVPVKVNNVVLFGNMEVLVLTKAPDRSVPAGAHPRPYVLRQM